MQTRPGEGQSHTERSRWTQNETEGCPCDQCEKGGDSVSVGGSGMLYSMLFLERLRASEKSLKKP